MISFLAYEAYLSKFIILTSFVLLIFITLAIIYIIRDPRDVVVSYSKYRHLDYDKTIEHMIGSKANVPFVRDVKDASNIEITGSWAFHYNSWKDGISVIPRIIIKYEDLL